MTLVQFTRPLQINLNPHKERITFADQIAGVRIFTGQMPFLSPNKHQLSKHWRYAAMH